jgi:ligand-binding sensor domain-containing protein/signal transduction histidine kinase
MKSLSVFAKVVVDRCPVRQLRTAAIWLWTFFLLMACLPCTGQVLTQYAHKAWRIQDGVFDAVPTSIAQTTDGYLWIGTESGLIRFDGVHFQPWTLLPDGNACCVFSLLGSRDGSLWIGTNNGLQVLSNGNLHAIPTHLGRFNQIIEDRKGNIWTARSRIVPRDVDGPLCEATKAGLNCLGKKQGLNCPHGTALSEDGEGRLWLGDINQFCVWDQAATAVSPLESSADDGCVPGIGGFLPNSDGSMLIGCYVSGPRAGLQHYSHGRSESLRFANLDGAKLRVTALLRDRSGGLWIGTSNQGLYHVVNGVTDLFGEEDGLSNSNVGSIFEDREGNIWVATACGIDRFRKFAVTAFTTRQGLKADGVPAVTASPSGTLWIPSLIGLNSISDGQYSLIDKANGLPGQQVTAVLEDHEGVLWMGIDKGLYGYSKGHFHRASREDGKPIGIVARLAEDSSHQIWIGTAEGPDFLQRLDPKTGIVRVVSSIRRAALLGNSPDGQLYLAFMRNRVLQYRAGNFVDLNSPSSMRDINNFLALDRDTLFVASSNGIFRWKSGSWSSLTLQNGLPCENVHDIAEDTAGALWAHLPCGFARISAADLARWTKDPQARLDIKLYDALDGAVAGYNTFTPAHAMTPDGRLWFASDLSLQMIDPSTIDGLENHLPPPVHVTRIVGDQKPLASLVHAVLPRFTHAIEIDYAALSLGVPEKVHFRYILRGADKDWQEVGSRREAFYMNLPPGHYHFQVIACNNDGVWNTVGDTLAFEITPAFYQTKWFRGLLVLIALALWWGLLRLRTRQLATRVEVQLGVRLVERDRIARELHDTLLQGFQMLMLRFQTVADAIPQGDARRNIMEETLGTAQRVLEEGRERVRDLRAREQGDFTAAIREFSSSLEAQFPTTFQLTEEGEPMPLSPLISDEVNMIVREALANAFRHAQASIISCTLRYGASSFVFECRDNGIGFDPASVNGTNDRWGLIGMKERAAKVGGTLHIGRLKPSGTSVELRLRARIAYGPKTAGRVATSNPNGLIT